MVTLSLLSLVLIAIACSEVKGKRVLYGQGLSNTDDQEYFDQICPKPNSNDRKFVRIKTYNNKYIWAYQTKRGEGSYLRTRCCGATDNKGRKDVTIPNKHTTFLIHCTTSRGQKVVQFEILDKNNRASGYYFYANPAYDNGIYAYPKKTKASIQHRYNFILKRWRGPVIAMRTQGDPAAAYAKEMSNWVTFSELEHGYVSGYNKPFHSNPDFPSITDTFTFETVPSGCVDGASWSHYVLAALKGTSADDCERQPDKCYWTEDWDRDARDMETGNCYYNKDESPCYIGNVESFSYSEYGSLKEKPETCESSGLCYNYRKGGVCFRVLSKN